MRGYCGSRRPRLIERQRQVAKMRAQREWCAADKALGPITCADFCKKFNQENDIIRLLYKHSFIVQCPIAALLEVRNFAHIYFPFFSSSFMPFKIHDLDSSAYLSIASASPRILLICEGCGTLFPFCTAGLSPTRSKYFLRVENSSISTPAQPPQNTHGQIAMSAMVRRSPTR